MSLLALLPLLVGIYIAQIAEQYNAHIDDTLEMTSQLNLEFERTQDRIDDKIFNNKESWVGSEALEQTGLIEVLNQAGYSGDLEGYIQLLEYDVQYFDWFDMDQNEKNMIRTTLKSMALPSNFNEAYYYEQDGDIDRLYFIGEDGFHQVYYETESTIFVVMYYPKQSD